MDRLAGTALWSPSFCAHTPHSSLVSIVEQEQDITPDQWMELGIEDFEDVAASSSDAGKSLAKIL